MHVSCRDAGATLFDCELGHARIAMHELTAQPGNEFELRLSEASYWRKPDPVLKVFTHFHLDRRAAPPPQEPSSSLDVLQLRQLACRLRPATRTPTQSFAPSGKKVPPQPRTVHPDRDHQRARKVQLSIKAHPDSAPAHPPTGSDDRKAELPRGCSAAGHQGTRSSKLWRWRRRGQWRRRRRGRQGTGVGADEAVSAGEGANAGVGASASAGAGDEAADGVAREWRKGLAATRAARPSRCM